MVLFRLVNHTGSVVFTCRVIHSLPLLQSVVHVFYQDKMAAVAHLVGSDTLPLPTQVCMCACVRVRACMHVCACACVCALGFLPAGSISSSSTLQIFRKLTVGMSRT